MADDGEQVHIDSGSNAGKWILLILALLVVAAAGYGFYTEHTSIEKLTADLATSQAQVKELEHRREDIGVFAEIGILMPGDDKEGMAREKHQRHNREDVNPKTALGEECLLQLQPDHRKDLREPEVHFEGSSPPIKYS